MSKKLSTIALAVNEVISKSYVGISMNTFQYNSLYQVFCGENTSQTIPLVFGSSLFWRVKLHLKNLRKKSRIKNLEILLPKDAIFFYREDKEGIIAVSPQFNFVLKLFCDPPHITLLEREITALKKIKDTPFEIHSSTYMSDGSTSSGARWVITDFRKNTHSLKSYSNFEKNWLEISYQEIMPRMSLFYKINEPVFISYQDWINKTSPRIESHPERELLMKSLELISSNEEAPLLMSVAHFDLHTGNVLHSEDVYSIIDWEGSFRAPVLIDGFDFLRRYLQKNRSEFKNFDSLMDSTFMSYTNWIKENFGVEIPSAESKNHFIIYAIERTLFFWETAKINRLQDKRAIEKFILNKFRI